jgi:hypothetical protein
LEPQNVSFSLNVSERRKAEIRIPFEELQSMPLLADDHHRHRLVPDEAEEAQDIVMG